MSWVDSQIVEDLLLKELVELWIVSDLLCPSRPLKILLALHNVHEVAESKLELTMSVPYEH